MARNILFQTYREHGFGVDHITVEKYGDSGYAIEGYKTSGGGILYIGFTPEEFRLFVEALEDGRWSNER